PGDHHAARIGDTLQSLRNNNPLSMDIVTFHDHVAKVDANSKREPAVGPNTCLTLRLGALDIDCAAHCIDHAVELNQQPVAHSLNQPAIVRSDARPEDLL